MNKRMRLKDFTNEELGLYQAIHLAHTVEDVLSKYDCPVEQAYEVADIVLDNLPDSYFESYWTGVDEAAIDAGLTPRSDEPKCLRCMNCPGDLLEQDGATMFCPASGGGFAKGEEDIDCDCFEETYNG